MEEIVSTSTLVATITMRILSSRCRLHVFIFFNCPSSFESTHFAHSVKCLFFLFWITIFVHCHIYYSHVCNAFFLFNFSSFHSEALRGPRQIVVGVLGGSHEWRRLLLAVALTVTGYQPAQFLSAICPRYHMNLHESLNMHECLMCLRVMRLKANWVNSSVKKKNLKREQFLWQRGKQKWICVKLWSGSENVEINIEPVGWGFICVFISCLRS